MGKKKIWIEVCLLSGRGLIKRSSSLWKLQWYAVGWIHPHNHKYCTKIDASGKPNPVWKTGFSTPIEFDPNSQSQPNFEDLALHVEVYSRDPIFLRESLLGSATILLKEFLDKYYYCNSDSDARNPVDEVGSFQLRKRNSNKPLGFVDVSIRISEKREEEPPTSSYLGADEGFNLDNFGGEIKEGKRSDHGGSLQPSKHNFPLPKSQQPQTSYQMPIPPNYPHHPPVGGASYSAAPPPAAPPPPPPSNVGYIPNFFPMTSNHTSSSYINMPSAGRGGGVGVGAGFGTGAGAGALAAGAVIFGDDFDIPAALRDASATISTYPPF